VLVLGELTIDHEVPSQALDQGLIDEIVAGEVVPTAQHSDADTHVTPEREL